MSLCGFALYISVGIKVILVAHKHQYCGSNNNGHCTEILIAVGSMSIIMSLICFVDMVLNSLESRRHSGYITIPIGPLLSQDQSIVPVLPQDQSPTVLHNNYQHGRMRRMDTVESMS